METRLELLYRDRLLSVLREDTLRRCILPYGKLRHSPADTTLITAGDRVDELHFLLHGRVVLLQYLYNGDKNLLGKLKAPNVLGLDLVCTRTRISPYCAVTAENTDLFTLPVSILLERGTLPESERLTLMQRLLQMISHLNMQKEYRIAILTHNQLRERITIYLTMQAARRGTNEFDIPFTREEMADFLSVNRSALSHELSLMQREGLIAFHRNHFRLLGLQGEKWTPFG